MKYFVKDGGMLAKVKKTRLRKLMQQGSKFSTPLERKALFDPVIRDDTVIAVNYYNPSLGHDHVAEQFILPSTEISLEDWNIIMAPVDQYPEFRKDKDSREALRNMLAEFEQLAKVHGVRQRSMLDPDADQAHVRASGKALKIARENIFKELGIQ